MENAHIDRITFKDSGLLLVSVARKSQIMSKKPRGNIAHLKS